MSKRTEQVAKVLLDASTNGLTSEEAEDLAGEIVAVERMVAIKEALGADLEVLKNEFRSTPDGMFFIIERHGFAIPLGRDEGRLPVGVSVEVSFASPVAIDDTYAIVTFGEHIMADAFRAESIFVARGRAETLAKESGQTVSLALRVGSLDESTPLFRGLAFIDYVGEEPSDGVARSAQPSVNTIQSLLFDQKKFDLEKAEAWVEKHGLKAAPVVTEGAPLILFHSKNTERFLEGSFLSTQVDDGVLAVIGREKGKGKAALEEEAKALIDSANLVVKEDGLGYLERIENLLVDLGEAVKAAKIHVRQPGQNPDPTRVKKTDPEKDKDLEEDGSFRKGFRFVKKNIPEQIVTGIVYEPHVTDAQGDFMTREEIRKMAHGFMKRYKEDPGAGVDLQHDTIPRNAHPVESFIADGHPEFKDGSWVMAVKVEDPEVWGQIERGELTGFSFAGVAQSVPVTTEVV